MPLALLALAIGGFGIGLTEFVIAGLLPEVAADFRVDEATAGWLISGYALSVAVGAIGLTAAVTRFNRKHVLTALMVLFIVGNLVSALATTYEVMLLGRILAALTHGAFFGIGSVVAADLVAPEKRAGAIALMFAGLTSANVLGVPFGTFLGQQLGWRSTFWAITVIGVVALVGMATLVPEPARRPQRHRASRGELGAFRSGQVWLSLAGHHPRLRRHVRRLHLHRLHAHRGLRLRLEQRAVAADPLRRRPVRRQLARWPRRGPLGPAHPRRRARRAHRRPGRLRAHRRHQVAHRGRASC